jgi:agmatinase
MALCFGGSDNKFTSFGKSRAVVIPVPYEKTITYRKGTHRGPAAILKASENIELFDEELDRETCKIGISTLQPLRVKGLKPENMVKKVEAETAGVLKYDKIPILLGGEHSITIGAVTAAKKYYKDLSALYFDAHYDLKDVYNDSRYNHACVARRLKEIVPVVEVGVRSLSKEEKDFLPVKNVTTVSMLEMQENRDWYNRVKGRLSDNIYISIDLDVFDPSVMPSVGTPEPGGIGWYEFLMAFRHIVSGRNVIGFDVVELSPIKDMIAPDFMAAKLIYKILGYIPLN